MDEERKYALNIRADDNRILSATYEEYAVEGMPIVDALPSGETPEENDIGNYKYVDGEYVYDPLPAPPEPEPIETADDVLNALLGIEQTDGGETNE